MGVHRKFAFALCAAIVQTNLLFALLSSYMILIYMTSVIRVYIFSLQKGRYDPYIYDFSHEREFASILGHLGNLNKWGATYRSIMNNK